MVTLQVGGAGVILDNHFKIFGIYDYFGHLRSSTFINQLRTRNSETGRVILPPCGQGWSCQGECELSV